MQKLTNLQLADFSPSGHEKQLRKGVGIGPRMLLTVSNGTVYIQ